MSLSGMKGGGCIKHGVEFDGHMVSVGGEDNVLEIDGAHGCPIICILLLTANCKLKGGYDSNFTLCLFVRKRKTL